MLSRFAYLILVAFTFVSTLRAASVVVAPANASAEAKARADIVCDGKDDQVDLLASMARAPRVTAEIGSLDEKIYRMNCLGKFSVEWLPGDYYFSDTLALPMASDFVIQAEGTYFHYLPEQGDAVRIRGMHRCRYRLGTIESGSTGAALKAGSEPNAATLMSIVTYTGLVGKGRKGTGLYIAPGVCTNRFEGTDIYDFETGIYVADAPGSKIDTNWFWVSYIRSCKTCVREGGQNVDDNIWYVNVEANIKDATAVRTGATFGKWYIIMGTWKHEKVNPALILDPGAGHNVFEIHPSLENFLWQDNSGNTTNGMVTTTPVPPFKPAAQP